MKLRTKLPLLLVPLIVLPLLILGRIAYVELRETSVQGAIREVQAVNDYLAAHMQTELETATANIELFAKNTLVRKYVLTADEEQRYRLMHSPLLRVFQSFQEAFPEYYELRIFLPDGYEDARLTQPYIENLTEEEGDNPLFRAMAENGDQTYTAIFRNPDNGRISLFVGKPLILRDPAVDPVRAAPRLRAYLAITVSLQNLENDIRNERIGQNGYLFATDSSGNLLFQSAAIADLPAIGPGFIESASSDGLESLKTMFNGHTSYIKATHLHKNLVLFSVLPEDELLATSYRIGLVVAAITVATIIFTVAFLLGAMEYLVIRPIHKLSRITREIGRGNWDIEYKVTSRDEIGSLATAFEEMANNLQHSDEQVRYLAYHDNLTGLPNRTMFKEYLGHAIAHAKRNQQNLAILFLDLDDFKRINDTLGHHAGDALLQEVAERLLKCLRQDDYLGRGNTFKSPGNHDKPDEILARLGGDEFIILLPDIHDPHAAGAVARRIVAALTESMSIHGHDCYISTSIGITLYPYDGLDTDVLIKNADIAMYHAKEKGKNAYQYFLEAMNIAAVQRMALENKLRKAMDDSQFSLHYQPQINPANGAVVGLEALLRWNDPDEGYIPPDVFIPVAEQTGIIVPIGEWVLYKACAQAREWQLAGLPPTIVSVNISGVQFSRENIAKSIQNALSANKLDPRYLEIEITESTIMSQPERATEVLNEIKAMGVSIALDDFGTGYSSLSYLRRFPIDTLKIDRSFIENIDTDKDNAEIVGAIVAMSHTLNLRVIAEGIETGGQLNAIVSKGCDVIQGFFYFKPLPVEEIPQVLKKSLLQLA